MADADRSRPNQKSRTRKDLLRAAAQLMKEGMALGQQWGARIGADVGKTLAAEQQ